jgi:hypothetical protein
MIGNRAKKKKICVFTVTRPSLFFHPDPRTFYWKFFLKFLKSWKFCLFLEPNRIISSITVANVFKIVNKHKKITNNNSWNPNSLNFKIKKILKKIINPTDRPYFFSASDSKHTYFFFWPKHRSNFEHDSRLRAENYSGGYISKQTKMLIIEHRPKCMMKMALYDTSRRQMLWDTFLYVFWI